MILVATMSINSRNPIVMYKPRDPARVLVWISKSPPRITTTSTISRAPTVFYRLTTFALMIVLGSMHVLRERSHFLIAVFPWSAQIYAGF